MSFSEHEYYYIFYSYIYILTRDINYMIIIILYELYSNIQILIQSDRLNVVKIIIR